MPLVQMQNFYQVNRTMPSQYLRNQLCFLRICKSSSLTTRMLRNCTNHVNRRFYHEMNHKHEDVRQLESKTERRFNEINIQMLSKSLHEQIFPSDQGKFADLQEKEFEKIKKHLDDHGLWGKECTILNDVNFEIPKFKGKNINEHFENIASEQSSKYLDLAKDIAFSRLPPIPTNWLLQHGWTKYGKDGSIERVKAPNDDVFVFDVEVCMNASELPILATAASKNAWYYILILTI